MYRGNRRGKGDRGQGQKMWSRRAKNTRWTIKDASEINRRVRTRFLLFYPVYPVICDLWSTPCPGLIIGDTYLLSNMHTISLGMSLWSATRSFRFLPGKSLWNVLWLSKKDDWTRGWCFTRCGYSSLPMFQCVKLLAFLAWVQVLMALEQPSSISSTADRDAQLNT